MELKSDDFLSFIIKNETGRNQRVSLFGTAFLSNKTFDVHSGNEVISDIPESGVLTIESTHGLPPTQRLMDDYKEKDLSIQFIHVTTLGGSLAQLEFDPFRIIHYNADKTIKERFLYSWNVNTHSTSACSKQKIFNCKLTPFHAIEFIMLTGCIISMHFTLSDNI
jgi:hypothetical protein